MPKDKRISKELLTEARMRLRTAPKRDPDAYKLEEAIADLMPDIKSCFGKGYDAASVADLLKEVGIEYSKTAIMRLLPLKNGRDKAAKSTATNDHDVAQKVQSEVQSDDVDDVIVGRLHQGQPVGVRTI